MLEALTVIPDVAERVVSDPTTGERRYYYSGVLMSDMVKLLTFVPVYDLSKRTYLNEVTANGYQRPGSATRMRLFGDFVREHPLSVVPPVMLSGRGQWSFDSAQKSLVVRAPAAIIDGQHRVGGYAYRFEEDQVSRSIEFILLPELSLQEEMEEFRTINTTQKGVPKSLSALLGGLLGKSDEALVALELDQRHDSPFYQRITRAQRGKEDLFSLNAVEKNVGRTFSHGALQGMDVDQRVDIMFRYWTMIADQFPEEWQDMDSAAKDREFKLLETTGLIAWSLAAQDILGPAFDPESETMDWDRVERQIKKLASGALDWRKDGEFQGWTGEVGGRRIHQEMQLCLAMNTNGEEDEEQDEGRLLRKVAETRADEF